MADPHRLGVFYTKVGTYLDRLGIAPGSRSFMRFRVNNRVTVLESRTAGIADTWTTEGSKSLVGGGGVQYILPQAAANLEPVPNP